MTTHSFASLDWFTCEQLILFQVLQVSSFTTLTTPSFSVLALLLKFLSKRWAYPVGGRVPSPNFSARVVIVKIERKKLRTNPNFRELWLHNSSEGNFPILRQQVYKWKRFRFWEIIKKISMQEFLEFGTGLHVAYSHIFDIILFIDYKKTGKVAKMMKECAFDE